MKVFPSSLALIQFIKEMTFELQPDRKLWLLIRKTSQEIKNNKKLSYKPLLKNLGFDSAFARCHVCGSKFVAYFSKTEQVFLCQRCGSKIDKNELVLI
jgi:recombinational DNA repair protein (RecF pathway)